MTTIHQLLQLFARSILAKFNALNRPDLSKNQKARLRKSITEDIRNCGGLLFPDVIAPEVSKAAQQEAERIDVNLYEQNWHSQTTFDAKRKTFQWEHVNPVSCIKKMCERAESEEATLDILRTRLRIAWILKRENDILNALGFGSKREDPDGAYRQAGIELLPSQGGPASRVIS